jgi:predicted enzyme involved in methoxymalonyl-ACP biosynthesis
MLEYLCRSALGMGCAKLVGRYIPTAKNAMAKDVYSQFGFQRESQGEDPEGETWAYDLASNGPIVNGFIESVPELAESRSA